MEKFHHKNLIERTKNNLFKIEHLIHLTKKGIFFYFFVCVICFCLHDKKFDI